MRSILPGMVDSVVKAKNASKCCIKVNIKVHEKSGGYFRRFVATLASASLNFPLIGQNCTKTFELAPARIMMHQSNTSHVHIGSTLNVSCYQFNFGT